MKKMVAMCGTRGCVPGSAYLDAAVALGRAGQNTGNLLFQYAMFHEIDETRVLAGDDLGWDYSRVKESSRILVVPAANFIREGFDFSGFVDFLEKCELPMVVVGLGAQAESYEKLEFDFHPSVTRFLSLIKERCLTIGVRGTYTAKVLNNYGVQNVEVTGCPSNFTNPDRELPKKLAAKWAEVSRALIINSETPWPKSAKKREVERRLFALASANSGAYVQQSVEPFVRLIRSANSYQSVAENHVADSVRKALAPDVSPEEFMRFLHAQSRVYFDVDQWLEDASRYDLSIGPRLHGNMVALQSGTPSIWIYHDARTQELAETMQLPRVSMEVFLKSSSIEGLKASVEGDWETYGQHRIRLYQRYRRILEESGIEVRKGLSDDEGDASNVV